MAQPSLLRPWQRFLAESGINSVSSLWWLMWSKRCWVRWPARGRVSRPSNRNCVEGGQAGSSHQKAARRARHCVVHPSVSVRPASPEQNGTQDPVAHHPGVAPVTEAACDHGTHLPSPFCRKANNFRGLFAFLRPYVATIKFAYTKKIP